MDDSHIRTVEKEERRTDQRSFWSMVFLFVIMAMVGIGAVYMLMEYYGGSQHEIINTNLIHDCEARGTADPC